MLSQGHQPPPGGSVRGFGWGKGSVRVKGTIVGLGRDMVGGYGVTVMVCG